MSLADETRGLLRALVEAGVEFVVVGGSGALMHGVPIVTFDLDIVHRRTPENVERLLSWLLAHGAYHRLDLANRRLPPSGDALRGSGHLNLQLDLGKLDVLCTLAPDVGYDELFPHSTLVELDGCRVRLLDLEKIIEAKAYANRPKDRAVLPLLLATLDEQRGRKG